jgi:hypothetical protein
MTYAQLFGWIDRVYFVALVVALLWAAGRAVVMWGRSNGRNVWAGFLVPAGLVISIMPLQLVRLAGPGDAPVDWSGFWFVIAAMLGPVILLTWAVWFPLLMARSRQRQRQR